MMPPGYALRPLESADYDRGLLQCLSQLSVVGPITRTEFMEQYTWMKTHPGYYAIVIHEVETDRIVGMGTLIVENKFLHHCGKVGHIEDIVVDDAMRGKRFGQRIIDTLKSVAESTGCYKVLLDCSEHNVAFYEKCGLKRKDVCMAFYFEPTLVRKEEEMDRENYKKYVRRSVSIHRDRYDDNDDNFAVTSPVVDRGHWGFSGLGSRPANEEAGEPHEEPEARV